MTRITPNDDQIREFAAAPDDGPVVMLNLLKFRGGDPTAYGRYGEPVLKMIDDTGGRLLWRGRADQILIGDPDESWDAVLLVEYPSRHAFLEMTSTPEYSEAHRHREEGLERTVVVACTPAESAIAEVQ